MDILEPNQLFATCLHSVTSSYGLYVSLFLAGLVGSISHCAGMCGPFVLSQTGHLNKISGALMLPYHLGRITTYSILAGFMHSLVNLAYLFSPQKSLIAAPMLALAGVMFLTAAFPALQKVFPWTKSLALGLPTQLIGKQLSKLDGLKPVLKQYVTGILLGFMPCGLVVAAIMASATAETTYHAMFATAIFGLGTMPALISLACGGHLLKKKFPSLSQKLSTGLYTWSALWLLGLAGFLLIDAL